MKNGDVMLRGDLLYTWHLHTQRSRIQLKNSRFNQAICPLAILMRVKEDSPPRTVCPNPQVVGDGDVVRLVARLRRQERHPQKIIEDMDDVIT